MVGPRECDLRPCLGVVPTTTLRKWRTEGFGHEPDSDPRWSGPPGMRPDGGCTLVLEPTADFGCKVMHVICTGHVPTTGRPPTPGREGSPSIRREEELMAHLEVIVRAKIRPGQLEGQGPSGRDPPGDPGEGHAHSALRLVHQRGRNPVRGPRDVHRRTSTDRAQDAHHGGGGSALPRLRVRPSVDPVREVSENFLNLVKERMGTTPAVFSFLHGLDRSATV